MADKSLPITGGCLCGAVRFEATEPPSWVGYCHCRMCQKAYGQPSGIFAGFKGAQKAALRFTKGNPTYYRSSAWLERGFCSTCGSPLGIRTPQGHSVMIGKTIISDKLINKINNLGELILVSQKERSQLKNKENVIEKFYVLIEKALTPRKKRHQTKPTKASVERRLESKRVQAKTKINRKDVDL